MHVFVKNRKNDMKVDVFIPAVFKDLNKLTYVIDNLILHCKDIANIHVSMPDAS